MFIILLHWVNICKEVDFEDVIIESGICASGSLKKVMSEKHYNHAQINAGKSEMLIIPCF